MAINEEQNAYCYICENFYCAESKQFYLLFIMLGIILSFYQHKMKFYIKFYTLDLLLSQALSKYTIHS